MPDAPEVQVNVAPVDDSSPPPNEPPAPPIVIQPPPQTDPEVTRLAEAVGTLTAEVGTLRGLFTTMGEAQTAELAALSGRVTAMEESAAAVEEVEEIEVPPPPPINQPADASAAVPAAAKAERGLLARVFLGR